uniref:Uncharacterized protein n=1 Tax=Siphoviridae sp. ctuUw41 TaxID=2826503 RepID=A0A8S5MYG6_9CAUD|nr:MAG TPA: hypothetical protein [Siphoviridae sp. ctuUw41]
MPKGPSVLVYAMYHLIYKLYHFLLSFGLMFG